MPRAVILRHLAFEDLGILAPMLGERGYAIRYLDVGVDAIEPRAVADADLAVILGAPIGVYDDGRYPFLAAELDAIGRRVRERRPTLGVCLGAQLMARALGADVAPTGRREIGYAPLTLTDDGEKSPLRHVRDVPVLHWHGDAFEIPVGAIRLAETPGFPNQAFAIGESILGLQFHLEADHRHIERWLVGHAHELATAGVDPATIRADAAEHGPRLEAAARAVFAEWLDAQAGAPSV